MKGLLKFCLSMAVMLVVIYFIHDYYKDSNRENIKSIPIINTKAEFITSLKNQYDNNEIVLFLEIPNVFAIPIPQTENNSHYYSHNIKNKESNVGSPFLDYRHKSLHEKKLIIYGYKTSDIDLPFNSILNYQKEEYFKKHPSIYLYTDDGKKVYNIFTSFIEDKDTDYLDIPSLGNIEFYEHLLKFQDKSLYDTGVKIDGDSRILVLTTSAAERYKNNEKYQVIMAIEEK